MVTPANRSRFGGFTLIELLVAIGLLALMALLSWRGLDGIGRAQSQLQQRSDDISALQTTLAQWGADLDALAEQPNQPSLDWDGRVLRLLRRGSGDADAGLRVVAWSRRSIDGVGWWLRWQSPELRSRGELALAWQLAQSWAQSPSAEDQQREVRTVALESWQIFYYRGNAWSNPLSSAGTPEGSSASPATAAKTTPDGVRLVLTLPDGQALSGKLTRDWVRPLLGGSS